MNFQHTAQPENGPNLLERGHSCYLANQIQQASELFSMARPVYEAHINKWLDLCKAAIQNQSTPARSNPLDEFRSYSSVGGLKAQPQIGPALLERGRQYYLEEDYESARKLFRAAQEEYEEHLATWRHICEFSVSVLSGPSQPPPPPNPAVVPDEPEASRSAVPNFRLETESDVSGDETVSAMELSDSVVSEAVSEWEHNKVIGQPPRTWSGAINSDEEGPVREATHLQQLEQTFRSLALVPSMQPARIRVIKYSKPSIKMLCKLMYHSLQLESLYISCYTVSRGNTTDPMLFETPCVTEILESKELAAFRIQFQPMDYCSTPTERLPEAVRPARLASLQRLSESVPLETSQLAQSLSALPHLQHLEVYLPRLLGTYAATNLGMALLKTKARSVILEGAMIGAAGCMFLGDYLSRNKSPAVQHLALLGGIISKQDHILAALKTNNTLLSLRFTNRFSYRGLKPLFAGLGCNTNFTLTYLDLRLSHCHVTQAQALKLLNLLSGNRWLVHCDLRGVVGLEQEFCDGVAQIVARNVAHRQAIWRQLTDGIGPDLCEVVFSFAFGDLSGYPDPMDRQGFVPLL